MCLMHFDQIFHYSVSSAVRNRVGQIHVQTALSSQLSHSSYSIQIMTLLSVCLPHLCCLADTLCVLWPGGNDCCIQAYWHYCSIYLLFFYTYIFVAGLVRRYCGIWRGDAVSCWDFAVEAESDACSDDLLISVNSAGSPYSKGERWKSFLATYVFVCLLFVQDRARDNLQFYYFSEIFLKCGIWIL